MVDNQKKIKRVDIHKKDTLKEEANEITPGMLVEASSGDLGDEDVSKPKVTDVEHDAHGNVQAIKVEKGAIFRKEIDIPADRVQDVIPSDLEDKTGNVHEQETAENGKVVVNVGESELEALTLGREQSLSPESERPQQGLLDQIEQQVPTIEGMREKERDIHVPRPRNKFLQIIGPGLLSGTSGNDPSAITSYAIDGANAGYAHLWLMLLTTPLYFAVQFACAKIGRTSEHGLSQLLREHYGRPLSIIASFLLITSNIALIAADLVAIGSGIELITGIAWIWFVVPVAAALWYLTVFGSFESFKKIFLTMSFVFIAYVITAFFTHANWGTILVRTFVPRLGFDFTSISSAVALLGATISPYSMFWQAQSEIEEKRAGNLKHQLWDVKLDVGSGAIAGQLVAYFVIICTASTIFIHHGSINTAADAARALQPFAGPFARYLFAIGLIGAGLVAVPVLLASTSYAVSGAIGWPGALAKSPWQNEGFYLVLTVATIAALVITLFRVDPIKLIFWSNILAAIIAPLLVIMILLVGNNRKIMQGKRLSLFNNICLAATALILLVAAVMLFYGLATGKS